MVSSEHAWEVWMLSSHWSRELTHSSTAQMSYGYCSLSPTLCCPTTLCTLTPIALTPLSVLPDLSVLTQCLHPGLLSSIIALSFLARTFAVFVCLSLSLSLCLSLSCCGNQCDETAVCSIFWRGQVCWMVVLNVSAWRSLFLQYTIVVVSMIS